VLILLVVAICGAAIGGLVIYRSRRLSAAAMLKRMPSIESLVLFIDFEKLRQAGLVQLLDGSKAGEDPDYRDFARQTDFHWAQDLDTAMLAAAPSGKYIIAQGRFDWKSLRAFVDSHGGRCLNTLCELAGSLPERRISFFPLRGNVMAMAVAQDDAAANRLSGWVSGPDPEVPDAPIWLSIPSSILKSNDLPEGTAMFAHSVSAADRVILTLVSEGKQLAAKLTVVCRSQEDATVVAAELSKKTEILRSVLAHEHANPGPENPASVLANGSFQSNGRRVFGYWPIQPAFVEAILGAR
jgi:hypothetical protein